MADSPDSTAETGRVLVFSDTEAGARALAETVGTGDALVAGPVAVEEVLDTLDARAVDCVVGDYSGTGIDDGSVHEQLRRTDVVYVPVVDFDDWGQAGSPLADEGTVPLPKPPSDRLAVLGSCIRAMVLRQRSVTANRHGVRAVLWELTDDVVSAPTQEAILDRVCEGLAGTDYFSGTWICGQQPGFEVRATAGFDTDRVERLQNTLEASGDAPWIRAANDRTACVYPERDAEREGEDGGLPDIVLGSVPLLHRGIVYGVVTVAQERPGSGTDLTAVLDLLTDFGKTVGQALAAAEMQTQGETVQQAIEQADPAIAIFDEDGTIEYVNAAFESVYGRAKSEAIGATVALLVPETIDPETLLARVREDGNWRDEIVKHDRNGRRFYADLSVAAVPVEGGTRRKYVAVASDITSLKEREQRLEVLNRVLRHNLRNDMSAVNGYAEFLAEEATEYRDYAIRIQEMADELVAISEKAREIEEVVAAYRGEYTSPISTVLPKAVEGVRDAHPGCTVDVTLPDEDVSVNEPVLIPVVRELVANGVEHNASETPRVTVDATVHGRGEKPVEIRISDNGPGIPDHELVPIREGRETALEHGSGLGLWLVRWGVTTLNGDIEFADDDPGTRVTIRLPARP